MMEIIQMMDRFNPLSVGLNQGNYKEMSFHSVSEGNSKSVGPNNVF